jgi:hypothetical protein
MASTKQGITKMGTCGMSGYSIVVPSRRWRFFLFLVVDSILVCVLSMIMLETFFFFHLSCQLPLLDKPLPGRRTQHSNASPHEYSTPPFPTSNITMTLSKRQPMERLHCTLYTVPVERLPFSNSSTTSTTSTTTYHRKWCKAWAF